MNSEGGDNMQTQMNLSIGNRLKKLRLEHGYSRKEVSNRLGIHETTLKRYEDGDIKKLSLDTFKILASFYNVEPYDIIGLENLTTEKNNLNNLVDNEVIPIEPQSPIIVYGKVCAGDGIEALEDPIDEITNPYPNVRGDLFALQVHGDSMNNIVDDGLYAIIKKQNIVNNGEIAVVLIDHQLGMLKRFYQLDDMVILRPDSSNLEHQPLTFVGEQINDIKVLGKFIGFVSPLMD